MKKSLYALLDVPNTATEDEIRTAIDHTIASLPPGDDMRKLAVKEAASVLGHAQRRAAYDASLHVASSRQSAPIRTETAPGGKAIWLGALALMATLSWLALRQHHHQTAPAQPVIVSANRPIDADVSVVDQVENVSAPAVPEQTGAVSGKVLSPQALFAQASTSIVRINVVDNFSKNLAVGSGVVIDRDTVITNCHVAKAGPRLLVKHGADQHEASIMVADEAHDLCKLSVEGLGAPSVPISSVAQLQVGQKVYAIGSPQGLDLTLSDGMVSSLRETPDGTLIQTSAPISPGSSGGGLFTEQGQLVGIVTFQMRAGQNLNFALPADWIGRMANSAAPDQPRFGSPAPTRPASTSTHPALLGTWHCFGPLTGRGLDATFEADGTVHGRFEGQPIGGRYSLINKQLNLMGNSYLVEALSPSSMVLSKGEGRRLSCNR
jgi:serine protease Do